MKIMKNDLKEVMKYLNDNKYEFKFDNEIITMCTIDVVRLILTSNFKTVMNNVNLFPLSDNGIHVWSGNYGDIPDEKYKDLVKIYSD